jgi:uncharacterized protein (TIGR02246 family)
MNSKRTETRFSEAADEGVIRAIHRRMIDAWNASDGAAFANPFTDDADFVAWEGTHLKGRQELAVFTQQRTEWRCEMNSNCRYRFVNNQTTASG